MSGPPIRQRILVVGVPRSGTTLVQGLLASHPELTSFTESHFFSRHYRRLPLLGPMAVLRSDPRPRLRAFLSENLPVGRPDRWLDEAGLRGGALGPLRVFRGRAVARRFMGLLDRLAHDRGAVGWVEKTPAHLTYLPYVETLLGPAAGWQFVHVVREGMAVVASLHAASRAWERPYDVETCARRWNHDLALTLDRVDSARDHVVFYDDLLVDAGASTRVLFDALGLGWDPTVLTSHAATSAELVTADEPWKPVRREIGRGGLAGHTLRAADRDRARSILRPELLEELRRRVAALHPLPDGAPA